MAFYVMSLCCTVTALDMNWMERAGLGALPPIETEFLTLDTFDPDTGRWHPGSATHCLDLDRERQCWTFGQSRRLFVAR